MQWWRLRRNPEPSPSRRPNSSQAATDELGQPYIRDAERRALRRLLQRRENLRYDVARAEQAFQPENPWLERIGQLDAAIAQAEADLRTLRPTPASVPNLQLPATPVEVVAVQPADPVSVTLRAGSVTLRYDEEVDWAERGHQLALPELTHTDGDVTPLIPDTLDEEQRAALAAHLRTGFSIVAEEVLERAVDHEPLPSYTLAAMTRPCPDCGGWMDPKGRCPACTRLEQQRAEVRAALRRLRAERDDQQQDLARNRERLPVLQRQLIETEADIAKLEAKGVEPA